jgi:hypothetical protein
MIIQLMLRLLRLFSFDYLSYEFDEFFIQLNCYWILWTLVFVVVSLHFLILLGYICYEFVHVRVDIIYLVFRYTY